MIKRIGKKLGTTITGGAIIIAFFSVMSKLLGLFRDRLLASWFGAGEFLDVYYAAFKLPDLIFNTLVLGAFTAAFIPVFIRYWQKDRNEAILMSNAVLNILLIIIGLISLVFIIFSRQVVPFIVPGFDEINLELTARLTRIMFIGVILFTLSNVLSGVLNSLKRFLAFSIAPVLYNIGIIVGIVYFNPKFGIDGLAWGVVLGSFLHMLIQLIAAYRIGWNYIPILSWTHQGVRKILKLMIPRTLALGVNQINQLVIMVIASTLAAGSIAIFNLANNLQSLNIIGISLALSCFPVFTETLASNDYNKFKQVFSVNVRRIIFIIVPLSMLVFLLRAQIVRIVLGAGLFDWNATVNTAQTLGWFIMSLFAQSLIPLFVRVFYSLEDTKTPVYISIFSVAINIIAAIILGKMMGVAGLALAFSIANILNLIILTVWLRRRLNDIDLGRILKNTSKIVLAALASSALAYLTLHFIGQIVNMKTFLGVLIQAVSGTVVALVSYLAISFVLGFDEVEVVRKYLLKFKIFRKNVSK